MAAMAAQRDAIAAIEDLAAKRGLDEGELWQAVADALLAAYRRTPGAHDDAEVRIDLESGTISVIGFDRARLDGEDVTPEGFGRVAASVFRQVVAQRVDDAVRQRALARFAGREGTVVDARVKHVDARRAVVDVEGVEGVLPAAEQLPGDRLRPGGWVEAMIVALRDSGADALVLSRTHPDFVRALVAREVPQVADGSVEIVALAREPGRRTKLAVRSHGAGDPVAAVIGAGGSRIRSVQHTLGAERVDVFAWDDDPAVLVKSALGVPDAQVVSFEPPGGDSGHGTVTVRVPAGQTARAVGAGGSNVRVAGRVVGWKIVLVDD